MQRAKRWSRDTTMEYRAAWFVLVALLCLGSSGGVQAQNCVLKSFQRAIIQHKRAICKACLQPGPLGANENTMGFRGGLCSHCRLRAEFRGVLVGFGYAAVCFGSRPEQNTVGMLGFCC